MTMKELESWLDRTMKQPRTWVILCVVAFLWGTAKYEWQHSHEPTPLEIYQFNCLRDWQFTIAAYRTRTGASYKEAIERLSEGRMTVTKNEYGTTVMTTKEFADQQASP